MQKNFTWEKDKADEILKSVIEQVEGKVASKNKMDAATLTENLLTAISLYY